MFPVHYFLSRLPALAILLRVLVSLSLLAVGTLSLLVLLGDLVVIRRVVGLLVRGLGNSRVEFPQCFSSLFVDLLHVGSEF